MNDKLIKILGIATTAMGLSATLLTDWLNDKKMDKKIEQKVIEAFTKIKEGS